MHKEMETVHAGPNLILVPLESDAGNYTCYADTASGFTLQSEGVTTTLTVSCEHNHDISGDYTRCLYV